MSSDTDPIEMAVTVTITVTDADGWANEYGLSADEVRADIADYYRNALHTLRPEHHRDLIDVAVRIA